MLSIPILTASTPMSSVIAGTHSTISSPGSGYTAVTATVFWAVIAVMAVIPSILQRANALRSAWIPAPPPESELAIESNSWGMGRSGATGRAG